MLVVFVFAAIAPSMFVIVAMMFAIIIVIARLDDIASAGCKEQRQHNAGSHDRI